MVDFGIISDVHGNVENTRKIVLNFEDVDAIILNGDINSRKTDNLSITNVLDEIRKVDKDIFVMPGSHESKFLYESNVEAFEEYGITDMQIQRKTKYNGIDIVSLPGSDWLVKGGEYLINKEFIEHLYEYIEDSDRTFLVSHIPAYRLLDKANFGEVKEAFKFQGHDFKKGSVVLPETVKYFEKLGKKIELKNEHRGNKTLKEVIDKNRIKFMVSAHIHEDGRKGVNRYGAYVPENEYSDTLYFNPGPAEDGYAGIYFLEDGKAAYDLIDVSAK